MTAEFHSCQVGEIARRSLTRGERGHVLASFSTAAYLLLERGELLWLASDSAPMHARAVRVARHVPGLSQNESFFVEDERIRFSDQLIVNFKGASVWVTPPVPPAAPLNDQLSARVRDFLETGADLSEASGFGRLIPRILSLAAGQAGTYAEADPVLAIGWPSVREVAGACLSHDMAPLFQEASALIGLGEGLTPSGDDFLCGLFFCIRTIQKQYPECINVDPFARELFIESARQRTHLISFALLRDSINGMAVEPLHELMNSVLTNQPREASRRAVQRLTQVGHSSGWDMLTGMLTGLLLLSGSLDLTCSSPVGLKENLYAK